ADGAFVFPAVPSGQYSLRATQLSRPRTPGTLPPFYWVDTPVSVAGDVDGVVAAMRPGLSVTARQDFQGSAEPPQRTSGGFVTVPFGLEPADGDGSTASIGGMLDVQGQVTISGFLPGRYFVRVRNSPPGWMFKAAMLNGVDVSETPLELTKDIPDLVLTFTDKWSGLGGTVRTADGTADPNAVVILFPTNAEGWK